MAAANGFITESPTEKYGTSYHVLNAGNAVANRFTVPGASGTVELTEIGVWALTVAAAHIHIAVFDHDAANGNPSTIVPNSDSGELSIPTSDYTKVSASYTGTKPVVNCGGTYWIAVIPDGSCRLSRIDSGGTYVYRTVTYPTWPSDASWDLADHGTRDESMYAVYATAQFARPSSDVAGGTFRSIVTTAPFGPRVIA